MSNLNIYKASAGSGKTYTLALEYIKELMISPTKNPHRHILAVTFTNDATGEMKDRILAELYGLAFATNDSEGFMESLQNALEKSGRHVNKEQIQNRALQLLTQILHDYSRVSITTIDSFFQKILRNLARELGKGSKFNIEMNGAKVRMDAVTAMIEKSHLDPKLINWLTTYVNTKLENDGNWRFKNDVFKFSACIYDEFFQEHESLLRKQLEENPKIFESLVKEQHKNIKLHKNYFQNTYQQVLKVLDDNQLQPNDFTRGTIINFWKKLAENPNWGISINTDLYWDNPEKWVNKTHKRRNEIIGLIETRLMDLFKETLEIFDKYNTAKLIAGNIHQLGLIWYIVNEIDDINRESNRFMLSDTASFLNKMIDDSDAPFIYEKIGSEIRNVMIDEFQDTSRLQWGNFKALLSNILANNYFSMLVGDEKQSIYRWRNGDWRILNTIDKELHVVSKKLEFNYRSEKQIIQFNNTFFAEAGKILNSKFDSELTSLSDSPFQWVYGENNVFQKSVKKTDAGFISVDFLMDSEEKKYKEVVLNKLFENIQELKEKGIKASDICILTRTNTEIKNIADFLSAQKSDFPELEREHYLNVVSNEAFELGASLSIKIILEFMKMVSYPDNLIYQAQLDYFLKIAGLSEKYQSASWNRESVINMPLFELITYIYNLFDLGKVEGQSAYLFFFYDSIYRFLQENSSDILSFISYWEEELKTKTIPNSDGIEGVRAMTIHKSKGLQFNTVLIPYCNWDLNPKFNPVVWCRKKEGVYDLELLPVNYSSKMENTIFAQEYQEETALSWLDNLNLLYVAFTRAEQNLIIFGKYKKRLDSSANIKNVSDLLQETVPTLSGNWDVENLHFETGILSSKIKKSEEATDNPLKQIPPAKDVNFFAENFNPAKSIFKQSNKSREFITGKTSVKELYIAYGAIMHELFARIKTINDIDKATEELVREGLVLPNEKEKYSQTAKSRIADAGVEEWFSNKYKIYSEQPILIEEKGEITTRRPDRILLSDDSTLIVDYKFGEPHAAHKKQMEEYISLLNEMHYPNVKACIWYVEKGVLEEISGN